MVLFNFPECNCDVIYSKSASCSDNGQCPCETGYGGVKCNRCAYNFYRSSPDKKCTGI